MKLTKTKQMALGDLCLLPKLPLERSYSLSLIEAKVNEVIMDSLLPPACSYESQLLLRLAQEPIKIMGQASCKRTTATSSAQGAHAFSVAGTHTQAAHQAHQAAVADRVIART